MKDFIELIQLFCATLGGFLGWFLGICDGCIYVLITFIVIDYITGLMVAILEKKLCSSIGFRGIFKKVLIFVLVGVAHMLDLYILGNTGAIRDAIIFFYISNEGISILENSGKIGLPIPEKLKNVIQQLKEDDKNNG